jgi:hypothetical protein
LPRELELLGTRLFPNPANREVFGQRLLARWPRSAITLEALLEDSGYLQPRSSRHVSDRNDPSASRKNSAVG